MLGANLYSPVFSQRFYLAEVLENAPPGSKVIQVSLYSSVYIRKWVTQVLLLAHQTF